MKPGKALATRKPAGRRSKAADPVAALNFRLSVLDELIATHNNRLAFNAPAPIEISGNLAQAPRTISQAAGAPPAPSENTVDMVKRMQESASDARVRLEQLMDRIAGPSPSSCSDPQPPTAGLNDTLGIISGHLQAMHVKISHLSRYLGLEV